MWGSDAKLSVQVLPEVLDGEARVGEIVRQKESLAEEDDFQGLVQVERPHHESP